MSDTRFRKKVVRFSHALNLFLPLSLCNIASAEFAFNFDLHSHSGNAKFVWSGDNRVIDDFSNDDGYWNPFETVQIDGQIYAHFILGDPASGFAQEIYTRVDGIENFGAYSWEKMQTAGSYKYEVGLDPLMAGKFNTGNGGTNPHRIIIHQYMSDGEIHQDFLKSRFDYKPVITQSITQYDRMNAYFVIDSSRIQINEFGTGEMTNTIDFLKDQTHDFDMSKMKWSGMDININAGQYIYFAGPESGGHHGFYYYADGGESVVDTDWEKYFDHSKNNYWSFPANKPVETE